MLTRNFFSRTFGSNRFGFIEVLSRLLNWATLPIAGLLIDPGSFGQVVLLSTSISILTTIGTFGQHRTILHYRSSQAYQSFGAIVIALAYATLLVPVGFFCLSFFQGSIPIAVILISLLTILHALLATQRRAFEDLKNFAFLRTSLSSSRFILVIGALVIFDNMTAYVAAEALSIILSLTFRARTVFGVVTQPKELSSAQTIKSWKIGAPLLFQAILLMAITHYDKLLLARSGQYDQLGHYGMLYMLAASVAFISAFIGIKYEPAIYQAVSNHSAFTTARAYEKRLFMYQGTIAIALVMIWELAQPIIMPNNTLSWFVLPLLFGGQIFAQSVIPWSAYLTRTVALLAQTISVAIAAVASISLNTLLIPEYGPVGAATTFLVSNALYYTCIAIAARLEIRYPKEEKSDQ